MKVFFCGGGTLGPVTPLIAAIDALKEKHPDITSVWIGTRKGVERAFIGKLGIEYHWIAAGKLRRYFDLRTLLLPFMIAVAAIQSAWLVAKLRPAALVVSGSFIQVPLVMVAAVMRVPVIVLQLDAEAGIANRISAFDAATIAASLEVSMTQFRRRPVHVIGAPVRKLVAGLNDPALRAAARERGMVRWHFDSSRPAVLVLGGGTGARSINEFAARNLDALLKSANVLVVTGKGKMIEIKPRPNFSAEQFLDQEIAEAFAVADLVIGRAGFGVISEIGSLGLPSVLIPLAGQQEKNASYLERKGAAVVMKRGFSDQELLSTVERLLNDRDRRREIGSNAAAIFPTDAAEKLAELIIANIKR